MNTIQLKFKDFLACIWQKTRKACYGTDLQNRRCYLCCKKSADTDEHIPPKCIYHKDYRNERLLTVPAHESCNSVFSKEDEYFRDNIVLAVSDLNPKAGKLFDSKVLRSFARSESQLYRSRFSKEMGTVEIRTPEGQLIKTLPIKSFDSQTVDSMMNRVTRGIYYHSAKMVLPRKWPIKTIMVQPDMALFLKKLDGTPIHHAVVPGIFEYYRYAKKKDDRHSTFFYVFYDTIVFVSYTGCGVKKVKDNSLEKHNSLNGIHFTENTLWVPKSRISPNESKR